MGKEQSQRIQGHPTIFAIAPLPLQLSLTGVSDGTISGPDPASSGGLHPLQSQVAESGISAFFAVVAVKERLGVHGVHERIVEAWDQHEQRSRIGIALIHLR